jgi:hypothetical protein
MSYGTRNRDDWKKELLDEQTLTKEELEEEVRARDEEDKQNALDLALIEECMQDEIKLQKDIFNDGKVESVPIDPYYYDDSADFESDYDPSIPVNIRMLHDESNQRH